MANLLIEHRRKPPPGFAITARISNSRINLLFCAIEGVFMKALRLLVVVIVAASAADAGQSGRGNQSPGPAITVHGQSFPQQSLFQRNIGGPEDMYTAFPPHKVIGNIYYVGSPNPFIDAQGYRTEVDIDEARFHAVLAEQRKAAAAGR
jgi:hypothetical protein